MLNVNPHAVCIASVFNPSKVELESFKIDLLLFRGIMALGTTQIACASDRFYKKLASRIHNTWNQQLSFDNYRCSVNFISVIYAQGHLC